MYKALTLKDLVATQVDFLLCRNLGEDTPNDLDILVRNSDYRRICSKLRDLGYSESSHDRALGGRLAGYQVNLIKKDRIKIDLHKDFTWRKQRYLETGKLWENKVERKTAGQEVFVPDAQWDAFLIIVNIVFEKTYITNEYKLIKHNLKKIQENMEIAKQIKRYNYEKTFHKFTRWFDTQVEKDEPIFTPFSLVIYSYWEKFVKEGSFDSISLAYYFYYRARYSVNKKLPYS